MYNFWILTINSVCIILLTLMTIVLTFATRLKGASGYAALIVFLTTVPVHIYNTIRSLEMFDIAKYLIYYGFISNTMLMPLLWLFVRKQFDIYFRFKSGTLLHFIPTFICFVLISVYFPSLSDKEKIIYLQKEAEGIQSPIQTVNDIVIFSQVAIYFTLIFKFIRQKKKQFLNDYSDSDYLSIRWVERLMLIFCIFFIIVIVTYILSPRTDAWLIPILNILSMFYLVYNVIANPTEDYLKHYLQHVPTISSFPKQEKNKRHDSNPLPEKPETYSKSRLSIEQMQEFCRIITAYLESSKAYKEPNLSIWHISKATSISSGNISQSINTYLGKNFFDLINQMRIEEAKQMLRSKEANNYSIEGIAGDCGFRSRSTFYLAFNKFEGTTPAKWLKIKSKTETRRKH